jgi:hypothetical protein
MVRFSEALPNSGVDDVSHWMMIPIRDNVRFLVLHDGAGLTPSFPNHLLDIRERPITCARTCVSTRGTGGEASPGRSVPHHGPRRNKDPKKN